MGRPLASTMAKHGPPRGEEELARRLKGPSLVFGSRAGPGGNVNHHGVTGYLGLIRPQGT